MSDRFLLQAIDVGKTYPRTSQPALRDFNFTIAPGEIVALLGHNGAGKTTALDIVAGLLAPTVGRVESDLRPYDVGWCPQRTIVDWSLTVRQNIEMGAYLAGRMSRASQRQQIDELAEYLRLTPFLNQTAETLSGGELQRTQIGRAMMGSPRLLLLDEPTAGLDPDGVHAVFEYLKTQSGRGVASVISTHETGRFADVCTRAVCLSKGVVIADMATEDFMSVAPGSVDLWDAYLKRVGSYDERS